MRRNHILAALLAAAAIPALAQTTGGMVQRDVNQQARIEQGLQSGQLNTNEAGRLEREEARIESTEAKALRDGHLSPQEKARITQMQDQASRDIYREKHNTQTADPNSPSSRRMQAAVQRDVNQQSRIEQGVQSGQLTHREVAKLESGQVHDSRLQARAAADGYVGPHESRRLQNAENVQSKRIYRQKHNAQTN